MSKVQNKIETNLFYPKFKVIHLSTSDIAELEIAAQQAGTVPAIQQIDTVLKNLGPRLSDIAKAVQSGEISALIRGIPIYKYDLDTTKKMFVCIGSYFGRFVPQDSGGTLVADIEYKGFEKDDLGARGTNTKFQIAFHTDLADLVAMLCLQQAEVGGDSMICDSRTVFEIIQRENPKFASLLTENFWYKRPSWDTRSKEAYFELPVFSFHKDRFFSHVMAYFIENATDKYPLSDEQREALDFVEAVCRRVEVHMKYKLEPGDISIFNNMTTFHTRTEFHNGVAQNQIRHLLRLWLCPSDCPELPQTYDNLLGEYKQFEIRGGVW